MCDFKIAGVILFARVISIYRAKGRVTAVCAGTAAPPRMNGDANRREGGEVKAFSDAEHTPEAAVQNAPSPPPRQGHNPAAVRRPGTHRFLPHLHFHPDKALDS